MTPQQFIAKWQKATLSERSACQQHFCDLCDLLGQPKPAEADPEGAWYTFERGVRKTLGGQGWADVWMRGHFGWEYKGKRKNLEAAYRQLLLYREDLENPPLLVVCDLDRFEVHTNFTGTAPVVHRFNLDGLADPENLDVLRRAFTDPDSLRPGVTTESITRQAAERFGLLADRLRQRGVEAHQAAHFLMKLMFCMFGEDIGLLPGKIFGRVLEGGRKDPALLANRLRALFQAMATGGYFGADQILRFNGGLFAEADVIELRPEDVDELVRVNEHDWAQVEPSIFGTLFERILDPGKRAQIGAHYTSRQDILTLLEPVLMTPLRRRWDEVRARCDELWEKVRRGAAKATAKARKPSKAVRDFEQTLLDFVHHLAHVRVLDPACGSGNFLYVAVNLLLDLEKEVIAYAATHGTGMIPQVRPTQLHGIEINPFAQELAQVVIWIGYLQWMHHNGFNPPSDPVLEPIDSIEHKDAILDLTDPDNPREPDWPEADFIVGNPPFLGDKKLRGGLGDDYIAKLFCLYEGRLPNQSDLCCYWFEKARAEIERNADIRAGLLATQGIRGGANRAVLERIKKTGDIFFAISDREWVLEGANVHVSIVGFDNAAESHRVLDEGVVQSINPNLTATYNVTSALPLAVNSATSFIGVSQHGPFEITEATAREMLACGGNPHGRPNSDIVRPILNATDLVKAPLSRWVVAFPFDMALENAALYVAPFEYVKETVLPIRAVNRRKTYRERWWIHGESRPAMQRGIEPLAKFIVTPRVSKHRLFAWIEPPTLPSDATVCFLLTDDYSFGVLHSRPHEKWGLALGTRLETRPRYTPTTCFETFPFPEPTDAQRKAIASAARELDRLRNNWLNPPEWTREEVLEFPGSVDGPWARYVDPETVAPSPLARSRERDAAQRQGEGSAPQSRPPRSTPAAPSGIGTVRYPRLVPRDDECAKQLKKRTLTNLYNQRPTWLDLAHRKLDEAVLAAYGWPADLSDEALLENLLTLNLAR